MYLKNKPNSPEGVGSEHEKATLDPSLARGNMGLISSVNFVMVGPKDDMWPLVEG